MAARRHLVTGEHRTTQPHVPEPVELRIEVRVLDHHGQHGPIILERHLAEGRGRNELVCLVDSV
jgi:hypothetical protein